jgi:hypothetical protein
MVKHYWYNSSPNLFYLYFTICVSKKYGLHLGCSWFDTSHTDYWFAWVSLFFWSEWGSKLRIISAQCLSSSLRTSHALSLCFCTSRFTDRMIPTARWRQTRRLTHPPSCHFKVEHPNNILPTSIYKHELAAATSSLTTRICFKLQWWKLLLLGQVNLDLRMFVVALCGNHANCYTTKDDQ